MAWLVLMAFVVTLMVSALLIRFARGHATRYGADMPQRFHSGDVPRLGGLAMWLGWSVAVWRATPLLDWASPGFFRWGTQDAWTWSCVLLPMMVGGISEDITQRLTVRWRLLLSLITALLAVMWLGLGVPRLDVPGVDAVLHTWPWVGMALAVLAVTGLPHAFNIIDGYNGLAAVVALVVSLALAYVALEVGDLTVAGLALCLSGATAGLLVWNYPRGLIFAGDGGAYFWGGVVALLCVVLVQRHPEVSPWFPMLLLIYPVWETLFSIYRKWARGVSPGLADALHFHQLIYRRLVRGLWDKDHARELLRRNNRTSPYLWGFTMLTAVPAVLFWDNTPVLMAFCALFVVTYVGGYLMMVRFKVPAWLRH